MPHPDPELHEAVSGLFNAMAAIENPTPDQVAALELAARWLVERSG